MGTCIFFSFAVGVAPIFKGLYVVNMHYYTGLTDNFLVCNPKFGTTWHL